MCAMNLSKAGYVPTRAPKQLGDFGEFFVNFILNQKEKEYEIAHVDHVGADLIAEKDGAIYAISVKTRKFKNGSKESRMYTIEQGHLDNLKYFAEKFKMVAVLVIVIAIEDEKKLEAFIVKVKDIEKQKDLFSKVKNGYSFNFGVKNRKGIDVRNSVYIDYTLFKEEKMGNVF